MMTRPLALRDRMAAVAAGICGSCVSTTGMHYTFDVVPPTSVVDIGCDHGKLAVWLSENTKIQNIVAADKHPLPLAKAQKLAAQRGADIKTRLSDGLDGIIAEEAQLITMSGISGITMTEILTRGAAVFAATERLVLLPACKPEVILDWLKQNGVMPQTFDIGQGKKCYKLILCDDLRQDNTKC